MLSQKIHLVRTDKIEAALLFVAQYQHIAHGAERRDIAHGKQAGRERCSFVQRFVGEGGKDTGGAAAIIGPVAEGGALSSGERGTFQFGLQKVANPAIAGECGFGTATGGSATVVLNGKKLECDGRKGTETGLIGLDGGSEWCGDCAFNID